MELGHGIGGLKADQEKEQLQYYLKALSAPMYDAKNVSIGEEHVNLIPGMVYNIGRSKSSCNIIFHDSRVSRQHCQLYVDPHGKHVYLIDGLVSEILKVKPEVLKNAEHQAREGSKCQGVSSSLSSRKGEEVCRRAAEALHEGSLNSGQGLPKRAKSSLNGIYVNGCQLSQVCKVLSPGDIVSLVAPTKGTKTIDPTFGAAVGFFVHGRQQVGGKTHKSLPLPLANRQGPIEAKLRHAISDGDKKEKPTHFPSQVICDTQEMLSHAQLNTISKACSTEGADKHEGAADHHPRDMSKNSCNGIATSLHTRLADAALLPCRNLSIKPQKIEKITLLKTKPIEKKRVKNRGQKRHYVESSTDIEDKREERFTSIEGGVYNVDDVLEDAPNYLLEQKEGNLVDEGKGKDGKGEDIVHSFLGRGVIAPVDMHRATLMEEHDKDVVLLPLVEQESYLKATQGLAAPGMYASEKMGLRETVRNGLAEACVIPTQLYTNPLSIDASIVKLAVFDICSPLLDHHIGYIDEPVIPAPTSHMEYLKSDTISRSKLAEPEYDQLSAEASDSVNFKFSLSTKKHEIGPPLPYTKAGFSESKDRVRSTAEILKLISKGAVKKDLEKPPLYFKNPGGSVSISNVKIDDEPMPQTPEDDMVQSLNQEVDDIMLGSPTLQRGGLSQTHRHLEEEVNINPEKKVLKTEKDMGSTGLDRNLEVEEEDGLQWTRLLSSDGPGLGGFCLNRLKKRVPGSEGTEGDISLQQLLAPLDEVVEIFAATFTSNILWFLNSNHFSPELPVTIACHDAERSWSTSPEDRTSSPYEGWPNLTVVYPSFPDALAFTSKSKEGFRKGIGCHHPKLFLVRFYNRLRVVISSANLNQRQWLRCTNTVWWKDFPQLQAPNYKALFQPSKSKSSNLFHTTGDFGAQLAYFISRLLADVPAQAHWIVDLSKYDFSSAEASLVISIPGIHGTPYPALSRAFLNDIQKGSKFSMKPGIITPSKFLGVVSTTVVGISFRFAASADPKGFRIRSLAKLLNGTDKDEDGMLTVFLKRSKNISADTNAVSVVVSPCPRSSTAQAFLQDAGQESNSSSPSQDGCVQLGFLSRDTAKWVAPLCDGGVCTFLARIWPKEALAIASGLSEGFVRLALHVFEGSRFGELRISPPTSEQAIAVGQLLCALQYSFGLHRLEQVLSRYRWPNSVETDFVFGSSSVGTSLDAPFLAAFSSAAGRRATAFSASEESDSQWGRWTANHEAEDPSVGIVFPTVERAKASTEGPLSHLGVLCFAEKAWERLKPAKILHDAVPYPPTRDGIPMHSKVAMRRFQYSPHGTSFGWVYCGSHNFSPAAWGRPLPKCPASVTPVLGTPMLISNYELGLLFVDPPPVHAYALDTIDDFSPEELAYVAVRDESNYKSKDCELENGEAGAPLVQRMEGLDRFKLPFVMPPPKYKPSDQPATGKALYEILLTLRSECKSVEEAAELEDRLFGNADSESDESEPDEDIIPTTIFAESTGGFVGETAPANMEQQYAEALWSQIEQF